jgi:hypothetical protein
LTREKKSEEKSIKIPKSFEKYGNDQKMLKYFSKNFVKLNPNEKCKLKTENFW